MLRPLTLLAVAGALAAQPALAQTIVLVRHAEKADAGRDPELSPAGQARAQALAAALAGARVTTVLTTALQRTRLTGQPTAQAAGVAVIPVGFEGGDAAHVQRVAALARQAPAEATVLIVGHSNTVPAIARALGDAAPQPISDCDFDRMTVIELSAAAPKVLHTRYGAPTTSC